jgi:membrane associated rhomboid family serine protease
MREAIVGGTLDAAQLGARSVWRRRATILLSAFLIAWYVVEIEVVRARGFDAFRTYFVVGALGTPRPAWVLAGVSHLTLAHLLNNVAVLLLYGWFAERHLGSGRFLGLFFVASVATTLVQAAQFALVGADRGVMGASGAILAVATYFSWHYFRHHADERPREGSEAVLAYVVALSGLGFPAVLLASDFLPGFELLRGTAEYGHLAGAVLGVAFEYGQSASRGLCPLTGEGN